MPIRTVLNKTPVIDPTAYIDDTAVVIGDVVIGPDSSVWPMAVIRGDVCSIRIGARTSIQDGTVIHVTSPNPAAPNGVPAVIGDDVTVGHRCMLHGCTIENRVLIGMGSIVLDGAIIRSGAILGAGSLVAEGKEIEGGYLWVGRPAKRVRPVTENELRWLDYAASHYAKLKDNYRK